MTFEIIEKILKNTLKFILKNFIKERNIKIEFEPKDVEITIKIEWDSKSNNLKFKLGEAEKFINLYLAKVLKEIQ